MIHTLKQMLQTVSGPLVRNQFLRRMVSRWSLWLLAAGVSLLAVALPGASAQMTAAPYAIPTTAIGSSSATQILLLTTTAAETISSFTVPASLGNKQEYTVGTVTGCVVDGKTSNPAGAICTVPITFVPAFPGRRPQPLQVVTSAGNINFGLNGLATGPLATLTPGIIHTYAGVLGPANSYPPRIESGDGGPATSANLSGSAAVATDGSGNLYIGDADYCVVRKVTASTGIITTVAGTVCASQFAVAGGSGDGGPATSAVFANVTGIAVDSARNIYISDTSDFTIRKVNAATGIVTAYAGNGSRNVSGDGGLAANAGIYNPQGIGLDSQDNLYFVSSISSTIRKVTAATGIITTVAGNGTYGYSGDGGPAIAAQLAPLALAVDAQGSLYIAEADNATIRKVTAPTGIITTVAGNHTGSYSGDGGPATSAGISFPQAIAVDSAGDFYFVTNFAVRKVESATGIITTVVGYNHNSVNPYAGEGGLATSATLDGTGVTVDAAGTVFVADGANNGVKSVPAGPTFLNYPTTTTVGTADTTDDPLKVTLSNIGNAALAFTTPATGTDPAFPAAWALDKSATCPLLTPASAAASVASGGSCVLAVDFTPTVAGTNTGSLVVTDNSLGATTSTQTIALTGIGKAAPGASLSLTPTTLSFPTTQVGGASAAQTIVVSSNGAATATAIVISITGANAGSFTQTNNCATTLATGATCRIMVTFTPQSAGTTLTAAVSVASSDPNSPATATLTGTGTPAGMLYISPTTQAFASTTVGSTSATLTSTVHNTTAQTIYLSAGSLTDANDFTQSDNCNGMVAAVTGVCTVTFTFTPKTAGALTSTYMIHDLNNPGAPLSVALSGTGAAALVPQAMLSPQSLTFTTVPNTQAYNQSLTLSNPGTGTLNIASILIGGTNASIFAIVTNGCGNTLAAGSACTITIGCTAIVTGNYNAALTVTDNATPTTQSASLSCTVAGTPQASLAPAAVAFGNINVGATSPASTITLTNPGTAALTINSISLQGTNAASYAIANNACGVSLAAGSSCAVTVTFAPTVAGSSTATLTVIDVVGTQTSALSGTGVAVVPADFTIAATPSQTAYRGASVNYTVQLASLLASNPFAGAVTLSATGLPAGSTVSFSPPTVVPGAATATTSVMTITVPALSAAVRAPGGTSPWPWGTMPWSVTVLSALALCFWRKRKGVRMPPLLAAALVLGAAGFATMLSGCGSNNGFGVPSSTSTITVTAKSGATVHTTQVTLTIL